MKKTVLIKMLILIVQFYCSFHLHGQSLPVGTHILEDNYRKSQLIGNFDQSVSFTVRPFLPLLKNESQQKDSTKKVVLKHLFQFLPITLNQQYNTKHPEGLNDAAMIPARGYQAMLSGGFIAKYGWLSVQFRPEFVFAENRAYKGFPDELSSQAWNVYYYHILSNIDVPDRFGMTSYKKAFWGQSNISLTLNPISVGLSNENLWWGPGIQNSLLMANNAPGFKHLALKTVRPIYTKIGSFEGQLICGRLDASGYPGIDTSRLTQHNITTESIIKDWRLISGLVLTYQPKWLSGLFLGVTKSNIDYSRRFVGNIIDDYLPVLNINALKNLMGINITYNDSADELASAFIRWVVPKSHLEVYFEYGREDHCLDVTDLLLELEYSDAYILGFRKLIPLKKRKYEFIDVQVEMTHLEKNIISWNRTLTPGLWYVHTMTEDGYTNNGQYIGAGIGTGSNMQSINISWIKNMKRLGLEFKRVAHEEDFWYTVSRDSKTHWVDIGGALIGEWDYKQFLINTKIQLVGSQNYQYLYSPGKITYNLHTELGITYLFK